MSDGLSRLKGIGAQKIHEQTHIARQHVQALLHETFDGMNKIQLLGFISILEREYNTNLDDLREKAKGFYSEESSNASLDTKVFVTPKKKKNYTLVYIIVVILIFALAVSFTLDLTSTALDKSKTHTIDNIAINHAKDSMSQNATVEDKNITLPIVEEIIPEPIKVVEVVEVVKSFKIMPKTKLWIGYIDLATHKKYQKLFKGELEIDPSKDWILTLGHGYVKVEINGEVTQFKDKMNIRLLYKDSKISKINFTEFKKLNKDSKW